MKKHLLLSVVLILFCSLSNIIAQEKVDEVVSDEYNRSSISVVYLSRGDVYDSQLKEYIKKNFMNSDKVTKFDVNFIKTNEINLNVPRNTQLTLNQISSNPEFQSIGKEILSYWFNRKDNGEMDATIVEKRGRYNVTDQDYFNAQVAKVGLSALKDGGYELVKNSYVLFLDYSNVEKKVDDKGNVSWTSQANVYVYKLNYTDEVYNSVMNSWIYAEDTEAVKQQKNDIWNNMNVSLNFVASCDYSTSKSESDGGLETSAIESYQSAIHVLENKIDTWSVASAITHVKPLRAKIGKKEGVKNTARYRAYIYTEDENGNLKSVPKGYVRATKVADNRVNASGETPESEFYQISGFRLSEGAILKQNNDWSLGGGLSYRAGSFNGYYLNLDKLISINTKGISQYALVNIGFNMLSESKLEDNGISTSTSSGVNFINASVGYGIGIRPFVRYFEFMPYVLVGIDGINVNGEEDNDSDDSSFSEKSAYTGSLGLKFNMNIAYPLQLFGSLDYSALIYQGEIYEQRNEILDDLGRKSGIGFNIGLKYIF